MKMQKQGDVLKGHFGIVVQIVIQSISPPFLHFTLLSSIKEVTSFRFAVGIEVTFVCSALMMYRKN